MAVQYRSQARQGQFAGGLKVPDKATAKRQSDKEEIQELKKQSDALAKRDETLIASLRRKYESEANTRKIVEQTRREGVEAEKSQRIRNAKLKADFAEMEADQKGKDLQALSELIPSLAESAVKIKENRDNYDEEQAHFALEKAGLTDDQWRKFSSSSLTEAEFSSGTQAWLVALRDQGGIDYRQYNAMMQRTGGYGNAMNTISVQRIAGSFPEWLRRNGDKVNPITGISVHEAMHGKEVADNNARIPTIQAAVTEYKKSTGWIDYSPAFSQKATNGELDSYINNAINTANTTAESQAIQQGEEKDRTAAVSMYNSGGFVEAYNSIIDPIERHYYLKNYVKNITEAAKRGLINTNSEAWKKFKDTTVYSEHGSGPLAGDNSQFPGLRRLIEDAEDEDRKRLVSIQGTKNRQIEQENEKEFQETVSVISSLPADQQADFLQKKLNDPNTPQGVKAKLYNFVETRNSQHNKNIDQTFNEMVQRGEPITAQMIHQSGITGETLRFWTKYAGDQLAEGSKARHEATKGDFKTTVSELTGRKTEFDIGQSAAKEVQRLMFASYLQKVHAYRNTLNPEDAHKQAKFDVIEEFKAGTDPDNPSGPYTYIKDPDNPLKSHFKFIESGVSNVTPLNLAQQYSEHQENIAHIPGSVFEKEEMTPWTHSSKVQQKHINRAMTIAELTTTDDTYAIVMRNQMLAADMKVPQWLEQRAAAHEQLILRGVSRYTLNNSGKPGVTDESARAQITADIQASMVIGISGGAVGERGSGASTGAHLDVRNGDGYTSPGGELQPNVLTDVMVGDMPLGSYGINSGLGPRISPGGVGSQMHMGFDFNTPAGLKIWIRPGSTLRVVARDTTSDPNGFGYLTVIQDTVTGHPTTLSHLSDVGGTN